EAPILITGMTGGVERGSHINHNLARAAAAAGIPMGVGSQRIALDDQRFAGIFDVKKEVPGVFLIGNIGAAQLVGSRSHEKARELCLRATDMISADALAIHVNVLQEMIQTEGDRDFRGVLDCIAFIARDFPVPLIVKEVGAGMDPRTAKRLATRLGTGPHALDVGGRGGTSWGWIEGLRATAPMTFELAKGFRDWGLTTGMALTLARQAMPPETQCQLVATGGIRTGIDVAKVVALGATMAGVGLPLFRAALKSTKEVDAALENLIRGLKTVMICTGSRRLSELPMALIKTSGNHNPARETLA
ncbi:MAG: type 2 isopentenyl-diphosphate Delta-isomerase, partial [Proteobacteria bacterium]|nr:type 2 isopentenyl-diphosphate Delta-isomerase [Pseudomonadota bacterium]